MVFWQCEHQVRINATTTTLPWYWLNSTCLPSWRLMASSGDLRGRLIASAAGTVTESKARAGARNRRFDMISVYLSLEPFHAGDDGAFPAELETPVVAGAGHGIGGLGSHRHLLPLF